MAANNGVDVPLALSTGTGRFCGNTSPSIATGLNDTNGNAWISQGAVGSAVNFVQINNAATTGSPIVEALGSDTNIILELKGKGTGNAAVFGTSTNDNAAAGYVGEFITATNSAGTGLTNATAADLITISLTAGDWDVFGSFAIIGGSNNLASCSGWINLTSATSPSAWLISSYNFGAALSTPPDSFSTAAPSQRVSVATTTTVYLSAFTNFATGSATGYGVISARRIR